jgi:hypothetical protein
MTPSRRKTRKTSLPHTRRITRRAVTSLATVGGVLVSLGATAPPASAATGGGIWQLDETSGSSVSDSSGNGNDGTVHGGVVMGVPGHTGTAFDFHASGSWVEVPSSDSLNPGTADFTVSAWVNSDTTPGSGQSYEVVRKGLGSTSGGEFDLQIVNHGYAKCIAKDSSGRSESLRGPAIRVTDGQWHSLACSRTGSTWSVTVDGTTVSTQAGLGSIGNTKSLAIGSRYGNGHNVLGAVDDVELSFEGGTTPPPPPPPSGSFGAHWTFTEVGSPPSVLTDVSGNGNDGTPQGGIVGDGTKYTFDGTGRVEVPDDPSLNPGTANFSYTVTFTTKLPASGTDFDVLRKGFASTSGGEYKVEVLNVNGVAKAFCLVKDTNKHVARIRGGGPTLADGRSHTITCSKTSTGVTIKVDGQSPKTRTVSGGLGSVSNGAPLTIGAKADSGGDWFIGTLSDASLS